jgi:hypothetical protein
LDPVLDSAFDEGDCRGCFDVSFWKKEIDDDVFLLIHFLLGEKHADMNLRLGQIFMALDYEEEMVTGMRMS